MEDERDRGEAGAADADAERAANLFPMLGGGARCVEAQRCFFTPPEDTAGVAVRLPIDADSIPGGGEVGGPLPHGCEEQAHTDAGFEDDAGPGQERGLGAMEGEDGFRKAGAAGAGACDTSDAPSRYGDSAGGMEGQRTVLRTAAEKAGLVAAVEIGEAAFPRDRYVGG